MMRALAVLALLAIGSPAMAANADQPDRNVNKANDKGGDTGNGKVDDLNRGQLNENQKPPAAPGDARPAK